MRLLLAGIFLAFSRLASASETSPEDMVAQLFDAMRAGDGAAITAMVVPDARLDRLKPDGSLQQGAFTRWIDWVDQQEAGDADEQIFGVQVMSQSPELTTVWAPFSLTYKGKFIGCGVNQFTLAKTAEGWKFVYGIDMPHKGDCDAFRARFPE